MTKLGEIARIIKGIPYRSSDYTDTDDGVAFVNLKCVDRNGGYKNDGLKYYGGLIKDDQYVEAGDILIANTDLTQNREVIGSPIMMPDIGRRTCFSLDLSKLEILRSDIVDKRWLYYYLRSNKARQFMISHSNGSTVAHLSVKDIPDMEIDLPDLATQKKIADTLSAFDDKIELNRQMNETLEEMGRALFRHYFIDNPEAKNWPMVKVGDVLQSLESGSRPRGGAIESGIPSIGAENVIGLGKYDYSKEKYISISFFEKLKRGVIQSGDVLLYKDGAYVGKKTMFMNGFPHERAAVNEHVFILRTNSKLPSQQYLYYWLDQDWITQKIVGAGIAKAAQPGINQRDVADLPIVLPPTSVVNEFNDICELLFGELFANALESRVLVKTRDFLASKLLN